MKIDKLFVLSKNKMLLKAIEITCKNAKQDCFVIDDFDEAPHFIEDLKPNVLLIDLTSENKNVSELIEKFSGQIDIVFIGQPAEGENGLYIEPPINPISLVEELEKKLEAHHG